VLHAGIEHRWEFPHSAAALRAGYFFEPTPAPLQTGLSNVFDNDRHVATLGGGISGTFRGTTLTFDLFSQLHVLATRTNVKDASAASTLGYSSIASGGSMFLLGATITVSL
jgi:long-chain fatty acid transport protein